MYTVSWICLLTFISHLNGELLKLQSGAINGTIGKSKNGRLFQQFYAIPYAEPPVGELRFKLPVPAKSWSEVRDATKPPSKCIQPETYLVMGDHSNMQEDCLYLNVFVPNDLFKSSGKAPVMVWIHGGSFVIGSGADYNPEYFMDKDVILVTVNYRLGIFGFFGLNNDVFSGNFGLKDQVLALQWVKNNIAAFGGDPNNVTLMGESAGSASVHLHMFSPLSKDLFQKSIMQSGSGFAVWAVGDERYGDPISITAFLMITHCVRNDYVKILKCLQHIPVEDLITLGQRLYDRGDNKSVILFKPMVESYVKNGPFLPQKPTTKTAYLTNVPCITGINSGEGAMKLAKRLMNGGSLEKIVKADKESIVPLLSAYENILYPIDINNTAQKIVDFYFGSKDAGSNKALKFVDIITDLTYFYPLVKTVQSSRGRQYVYYYDHRGSFSWQDFANLTIDLGVSHADELPLLFRSERLEAKWSPGDKLVSEMLIEFWTNFAITGDPNGPSGEKLWKPTSSEGDIEYLHIKSNSTMMEKNLLKERYEFWESLLH